MPLLVALALLLMLMALPSFAEASVVSRSGDTITVSAGPGEVNNVTLASECCYYEARVTDSAGVTAGGDCTQVSATAVNCGVAGANPQVLITLGDGNDSFEAKPSTEIRSYNVDGGSGDDTVLTEGGTDIIHGGDGNDSLNGNFASDQVYGDAGDDVVVGSAHADSVSGGPGRDRIEGDATGIYTNGGSDTIDSRDGEADTVGCGYGTDVVTADSLDVIEGGGECEGVDIAGGPAGGGSGGDTTPAALTVGLTARSTGKISNLISRSGFAFEVDVSGACRATAKIVVAARDARRLRLGTRAVTLASVTVALTEAGVYDARLGAARKYRAKLKRLRRVPTTLSFSCASADETKRASRRVTFTRSSGTTIG